MNLGQVVDQVISITKRKDKSADIIRCVNSVLSLSSTAGIFPKDYAEVSVVVGTDEYTGFIEFADIPRFRKALYILQEGASCPLEKITPLEYVKSKYSKQNCWYITNDRIVYRLAKKGSPLIVGYYRYPEVLEASTDTHWLLEDLPYMIIEGASAMLFRNIGDETSARQHEATYRLQLDTLINDIGEPDNGI